MEGQAPEGIAKVAERKTPNFWDKIRPNSPLTMEKFGKGIADAFDYLAFKVPPKERTYKGEES